jgi:hypothetical protein
MEMVVISLNFSSPLLYRHVKKYKKKRLGMDIYSVRYAAAHWLAQMAERYFMDKIWLDDSSYCICDVILME